MEVKNPKFGFVSFENFGNVQKVIEGMNWKVLNGNQVYVSGGQNKVEKQSELKQKFEQIKQDKLFRCKSVIFMWENLKMVLMTNH